MSKERFRPYSAVHLFLMRDGKVLLSQRFNTGYRDGEYSVPAGHLDGRETSTMAMIRESLEEVGIHLQPEDLNMVHTMHVLAPDRESLSTFFVSEKWQGEVTNQEPEKCSDLSWFPLDKLPENTIPYVRHALQCVQKDIAYSEFGWE